MTRNSRGEEWCASDYYTPLKAAEASKPEPQAQAGEPMHDSAVPVWKYHELERKNTSLHIAIAKKDAALKACVEALELAIDTSYSEATNQVFKSAITQAEGAMK